MRDAADDSTDPASNPEPAPQRPQPPAPDPADLGTAYGMELSIDSSAKPAPAEDDLTDPLGWIRRWVDQHKPA